MLSKLLIRVTTSSVAVAILCSLLVGGVPPARATAFRDCEPGTNGCVPNPDQCRTGDFNGVWDENGKQPNDKGPSGPFTKFAVCNGDGTQITYYVGGNVEPLCGQIIVADVPAADADDPNSCASHWPANYTVMHESVDSGSVDAITKREVYLDGWIVLPPAPDGTKWTPESGVRFPVVLDSGPYLGQQINEFGEWQHSIANDRKLFLDHGYALANFNVRGTGNSGGCFEWHGTNEQNDQVALVNWLGDSARPWSNGRVAMSGLSYNGTTPWEAAIHNPPALKTIITADGYTNDYTRRWSPQGLSELYGFVADPASEGFVDYPFHLGIEPPIQGKPTDVQYWSVDHAPVQADRICPDVLRQMVYVHAGGFLPDRDGSFWEQRNLIKHFPDVRVPVFFTHGFGDPAVLWEEDNIWTSLARAPKRMIEGQWGHEWPARSDWDDQMISWLDAWMKNKGHDVPGLGTVEYQDDSSAWHTSTSWPPAESHQEVLYLGGHSFRTTPGSGSRSFLAAQDARNIAYGDANSGREDFHHLISALCPVPSTGTALDDAASDQRDLANGLLYESPPLANAVTLAGNPFAYLNLKSSLPGGQFNIAVVDEGPNFTCTAGVPDDAREIALGGVDLQFAQGNYAAQDWDTAAPLYNTPKHLRVDLWSLAKVIPAGHKLAIVVGYGGDDTPRYGLPYTPIISILGDGGAQASQVILPIVDGTLGGSAPTISYPPRPFLPTTCPGSCKGEGASPRKALP